jgi:hypothetical protein
MRGIQRARVVEEANAGIILSASFIKLLKFTQPSVFSTQK